MREVNGRRLTIGARNQCIFLDFLFSISWGANEIATAT